MNDLRTHSLEHVVERTILILAKRETVFRFFTDSARFASWWGAGSSIDAREGGAVVIRYPNGETASGEILSISPPEEIVFTYGYDAPGKLIAPGGSTVRIGFEARRGGTLVNLRHEVDSAKVKAAHVAGWRHQLALFSNAVSNELAESLAGVLDSYFAAWNGKSAGERAKALDASVSDDVTLRDAYAALFSRAELEEHLAIVPIYMPGMTLKRTGSPRHCQGTGTVDWVMEGPDGAVRGRGTNVFDVAEDGRLLRIVGLWGAPGS
jgi:uncharacterized protein YndB with AHSA1/START domain